MSINDEPLVDEYGDIVTCIDEHPDNSGCSGPVEYRYALSGTGISYPRCDKHWDERCQRQEEINQRYPENPPSDWSPLDAGEYWSDDY